MIRGHSRPIAKSKTPRAVLRYYPEGIFFCDRPSLTPSNKKFPAIRAHLLPLAKRVPTMSSTSCTAHRRDFCRALHLQPFSREIGALIEVGRGEKRQQRPQRNSGIKKNNLYFLYSLCRPCRPYFSLSSLFYLSSPFLISSLPSHYLCVPSRLTFLP